MSKDDFRTINEHATPIGIDAPAGGECSDGTSSVFGHDVPGASGDSGRRHIWMLDVLGELHRFATYEGLPRFADAIDAVSVQLLEEVHEQATQKTSHIAQRTATDDES